MEFNKEDNLPKKAFKKMFYNYEMNKLYPFSPINLDYINIYNKSNYVDLLMGHWINNNKESIQILKKKEKKIIWKKKIKKIRESNSR